MLKPPRTAARRVIAVPGHGLTVLFDTRDLDVELALHVVQCTRPVELPFPFLTIEALVELTGIPAEDFLTYARNFNGEGYDREASQRGVIVHRVDGYGTMKTH